MIEAYKEYSSLMSYEEYLHLQTKSCVDSIKELISFDYGMDDVVHNRVNELLNRIMINEKELQAIKE